MGDLPLLLIVTGLPASGKSTLAERLAAELALPLFAKDRIKELLFDTLGVGDRDWSRRLGAACNELLYQVAEAELAAGRSCLLESNFSAEIAGARLGALRARRPFQLAQVLCLADGDVLAARFRGRSRHPGHLDHVLTDELAGELARGRAAPLALDGPVFEVDTTDLASVPAQTERLLVELRALLAR